DRKLAENPDYKRILRIAIVTARNAPSHERVVTTLKDWGVSPDECFFLGGMEKPRVLSILKPHVFFDDQRSHLQSPAGDLPMVHVPFGVANRARSTTRSPLDTPVQQQDDTGVAGAIQPV
ncbi:MAG: 5'-nucleotidase, partial [Pseudomonas putida]